MTDAELAAFIAEVRAELDARQALLDATDPATTFPPVGEINGYHPGLLARAVRSD